jgi:hypothetical protein
VLASVTDGSWSCVTGVLISPEANQEGNKLQRQILSFIYPIYNHNWGNISTIYIYKTRLASNKIFSPSNKIHREVGRAKDLSAPLYKFNLSTYDQEPLVIGRRGCMGRYLNEETLAVIMDASSPVRKQSRM